MKKFIPLLVVGAGLIIPLLAGAGDIPTGEPITLGAIEGVVHMLAVFFIRLSGIAAAMSIIVIGIWMMTAKSEESFKRAKYWFGRALLGALVIFGVGVILNTIQGIWTGEFFGGFYYNE